jgi:hypothetical protein
MYEQVRANPRRFIVHHGHESLQTEQVVGIMDVYVIVEKQGRAGRLAEATDLRT